MSIAAKTRPACYADWNSASASRAIATVIGSMPAEIELERTHFPGKRPIQMTFNVRDTSGTWHQVLAEYCADETERHADRVLATLSKRRHGQASGLDEKAIVPDRLSGLVFRHPGLDERLPGLRLLHEQSAARNVLAELFGHDPGPVQVELAAHRLGKRAVLRMKSNDATVYARLRGIKSEDGARRFARHQALWASLGDTADLTIPEPLGTVSDLGISFFAELSGRPLADNANHLSAVARAINTLQHLQPDGLLIHSGADEAGILRDWLDRCRLMKPELAKQLESPLAEVAHRLNEEETVYRPCHRDLHEKQILVANGVAGILDFDTLCLAHPALDVGNLQAHLLFAGADHVSVREFSSIPGIALWRRAALLRLVMIYAFTSTPAAKLQRLVTEASRDDRH